MGEYLQIFRARVPEESVAALLEIRPAAIAEAQRLCPELLRAELVRLDDGTWLDVLTWSRPDGEQRLMARAAEFDAITKMHDLLVDVERAAAGRDRPHFGLMSHDDADPSIDELARRAADGDREALSALVRELQHPMYRLALRFLGHPDDAQDACQEILIRIVTRLGTFEGRSKFTTWAYTVAVRSLLRTRKRLVESSVQGAEAVRRVPGRRHGRHRHDPGGGRVPAAVRRGPDQLHLRHAAVPVPTRSAPPTCSPTCSG